MSDEAAFLAAIRAAPDDSLSRLAYADWLEEQGRAGSEFLRIDCQIATLDPAEDERQKALREEMRQAGLDVPEPSFLEEYFWKRTHLVAGLRVAAKGLEKEWMAAVSRVSIGEIRLRNREIQSWLRKRVTIDEYLDAAFDENKIVDSPKSIWRRVRELWRKPVKDETDFELEGPARRCRREWIKANLQAGDELWEYNTGGDTWANLCGEKGYAIVRNGKVIEFDMVMEN